MRLSTKTRLMYAGGDFTGTFASTIVGIFYLFFLTTTLQISPAIAGLIIMLGNGWDAISDPLVGGWSDRFKHRFGRRRPFLLFYAFPLMISFALLWTIPLALPMVGRVIYSAIAYLLYITLMTLVMVPYGALCNDITEDYDERSTLQGYRMLVSIGGGLIAAVVPEVIVTALASVYWGHVLMGMVFAVFIGLAPLLPFFGTKERPAPFVESVSFVESVQRSLKVKPFVIVIILYLLVWASVGLVQAMLKYYLSYWLGRPELYMVVAALVFVTAAIAIPLWVYVAKRFDKKPAFLIGIGIFGAALVTLSLVPSDASDLVIYVISFILGIGVSAAHVIPVSMIPDAVEYGTRQIKSSSEGVFYGIITFVQKIGVAIAIGLAGFALEFAGFNGVFADTNLTNPDVRLTIRILIGFVPGFLMLVSLFLLPQYTLTRKTYHEWMDKSHDSH